MTTIKIGPELQDAGGWATLRHKDEKLSVSLGWRGRNGQGHDWITVDVFGIASFDITVGVDEEQAKQLAESGDYDGLIQWCFSRLTLDDMHRVCEDWYAHGRHHGAKAARARIRDALGCDNNIFGDYHGDRDYVPPEKK